MTATPLHAAPDTAPNLHAAQAVLPNLDGIRALACLLVVFSHMPMPVHLEILGSVGVGVFFVLSGFLMGHLYAAVPWNREGVLRYGIARFARIAPIYWLVVLVCILVSQVELQPDFPMRIEGPVSVLRHLLFGGNVLIFWSIPLEVQYYFFFVVVWWALSEAGHRVLALPLLALVCASLLISHTHWGGLMLPHKLHFFAAGTLAGMVPRVQPRPGRETLLLSVMQAAAVALLAMPVWLYRGSPDMYEASALGVAIAVAIYLLAMPSPWTYLLLASPWMRRIGQGSFSIYLMHMLVLYYGMRLLGLQHDVYAPLWLPLGLAAVLLPLLVSRTVEIPLQRYTRRTLEAWLLRHPHPLQPQRA